MIEYTKEKLTKVVSKCDTYKQVLDKFERNDSSGSYRTLKNFLSKKQIASLIRDIHNATQGKKLLITVDQEGGRVQRFGKGFSSLEAPGIIGNMINKHGFTKTTLLEATKKAYSQGAIIAKELASVGVDLSFGKLSICRANNCTVTAH